MTETSAQYITGPYMEAGARRLLPVIERYRARLGHAVLELGPNKHPLITPERYAGRIVYVENSEPCLAHLRATFHDAVTIVRFDLNGAWRGDQNRLAEAVADGRSAEDAQFGALVLSQILNYVDFRALLAACAALAAPNAWLFINNIMNHGVAAMLHARRPASVGELLEAATALGFAQVEVISEPAQVADPTKLRDLVVLTRRA